MVDRGFGILLQDTLTGWWRVRATKIFSLLLAFVHFCFSSVLYSYPRGWIY